MTRIPLAPVARDGHKLLIACDECPKDFWTTTRAVNGRGAKCPGCGALHHAHGRLIEVNLKDEPR